MNKIVVTIYVVLCVAAFTISTGEGYFGIGSGFSMFLTLPWSLLLLFIFAWALIHDGARSLLVFLIPLALLNAILLYKLTKRKTTQGSDDAA